MKGKRAYLEKLHTSTLYQGDWINLLPTIEFSNRVDPMSNPVFWDDSIHKAILQAALSDSPNERKLPKNQLKIYQNCKIYCITNTQNGKKYIGRTQRSVKQRFKSHTDKISSEGITQNTYLYRAMSQSGKEHFFIEKIIHLKELYPRWVINRVEFAYMHLANTLRNKKFGYNLEIPGEKRFPSHATKKLMSEKGLNRIHSKESNAKRSKSLMGHDVPFEVRKKISQSLKGRPSPMKGRELTSEHKKNISRSQTGKSQSTLTKEKISNTLSNNHPFKGNKLTQTHKDNISKGRLDANNTISDVQIEKIKHTKKVRYYEKKFRSINHSTQTANEVQEKIIFIDIFLISMIKNGLHLNEIAKELKVSIDCVRRLIAYNFSTRSIKKARQSMNH